MTTTNVVAIVLAVATLVVLLLVLFPFLTISSLNTLFGLGIPHNMWTYLSAMWLWLVLGGSKVSLPRGSKVVKMKD